MGMSKRFAVFGVGFFRVSGQSKQNLSKTDTSLKRAKFFVPRVSALGRFHCILRLFEVLPNFTFATIKTMRDYYL